MKIRFKAENKDKMLLAIFSNNDAISSQKSLANELEITEETLSRILAGKQNISMQNSKKILAMIENDNLEDWFDVFGSVQIRYSPMSRPNNHKIKIELG